METMQIVSWLYDKAARAMDHSYARMLNMTAKRLRELEEKQRWIPVTERLPETFGEFAVVIKTIGGREYADYADYDPFAKRWKPSLYFAYSSKVTHWMPLPEPPKEVNGE